MHKYYVINEAVEFHPATSKLRDLNHPENVVVLNSPAGRCLLLLIESEGKIVTQQEFMDMVWHKCGMMVSSNTYYQNICILRKGLKKIGFINDPIVTIPRIGLTLASNTKIIIKEVPISVPLMKPDDEAAEDDALLLIPDPASELQSPEIFSPYEREEEEPRSFSLIEGETHITPAANVPGRIKWLVVIIFSVIMLMGMAVISLGAKNESHYFDRYQFVITEHGCRFFLNKDILANADRDKALSYGTQFTASCSNFPWVYINKYAALPRASVIRCNKPMTESNRCISDYFIEDR